jgi:hypothetical protein
MIPYIIHALLHRQLLWPEVKIEGQKPEYCWQSNED